jgi:hypothetical protein
LQSIAQTILNNITTQARASPKDTDRVSFPRSSANAVISALEHFASSDYQYTIRVVRRAGEFSIVVKVMLRSQFVGNALASTDAQADDKYTGLGRGPTRQTAEQRAWFALAAAWIRQKLNTFDPDVERLLEIAGDVESNPGPVSTLGFSNVQIAIPVDKDTEYQTIIAQVPSDQAWLITFAQVRALCSCPSNPGSMFARASTPYCVAISRAEAGYPVPFLDAPTNSDVFIVRTECDWKSGGLTHGVPDISIGWDPASSKSATTQDAHVPYLAAPLDFIRLHASIRVSNNFPSGGFESSFVFAIGFDLRYAPLPPLTLNLPNPGLTNLSKYRCIYLPPDAPVQLTDFQDLGNFDGNQIQVDYQIFGQHPHPVVRLFVATTQTFPPTSQALRNLRNAVCLVNTAGTVRFRLSNSGSNRSFGIGAIEPVPYVISLSFTILRSGDVELNPGPGFEDVFGDVEDDGFMAGQMITVNIDGTTALRPIGEKSECEETVIISDPTTKLEPTCLCPFCLSRNKSLDQLNEKHIGRQTCWLLAHLNLRQLSQTHNIYSLLDHDDPELTPPAQDEAGRPMSCEFCRSPSHETSFCPKAQAIREKGRTKPVRQSTTTNTKNSLQSGPKPSPAPAPDVPTPEPKTESKTDRRSNFEATITRITRRIRPEHTRDPNRVVSALFEYAIIYRPSWTFFCTLSSRLGKVVRPDERQTGTNSVIKRYLAHEEGSSDALIVLWSSAIASVEKYSSNSSRSCVETAFALAHPDLSVSLLPYNQKRSDEDHSTLNSEVHALNGNIDGYREAQARKHNATQHAANGNSACFGSGYSKSTASVTSAPSTEDVWNMSASEVFGTPDDPTSVYYSITGVQGLINKNFGQSFLAWRANLNYYGPNNLFETRTYMHPFTTLYPRAIRNDVNANAVWSQTLPFTYGTYSGTNQGMKMVETAYCLDVRKTLATAAPGMGQANRIMYAGFAATNLFRILSWNIQPLDMTVPLIKLLALHSLLCHGVRDSNYPFQSVWRSSPNSKASNFNAVTLAVGAGLPVNAENCSTAQDTAVPPVGQSVPLTFHKYIDTMQEDDRQNMLVVPPFLLNAAATAAQRGTFVALLMYAMIRHPSLMFSVTVTTTDVNGNNPLDEVFLPNTLTMILPGLDEITVLLPATFASGVPKTQGAANADLIWRPQTGPDLVNFGGNAVNPNQFLDVSYIDNNGNIVNPNNGVDTHNFIRSWAPTFTSSSVTRFISILADRIPLGPALWRAFDYLACFSTFEFPMLLKQPQAVYAPYPGETAITRDVIRPNCTHLQRLAGLPYANFFLENRPDVALPRFEISSWSAFAMTMFTPEPIMNEQGASSTTFVKADRSFVYNMGVWPLTLFRSEINFAILAQSVRHALTWNTLYLKLGLSSYTLASAQADPTYALNRQIVSNIFQNTVGSSAKISVKTFSLRISALYKYLNSSSPISLGTFARYGTWWQAAYYPPATRPFATMRNGGARVESLIPQVMSMIQQRFWMLHPLKIHMALPPPQISNPYIPPKFSPESANAFVNGQQLFRYLPTPERCDFNAPTNRPQFVSDDIVQAQGSLRLVFNDGFQARYDGQAYDLADQIPAGVYPYPQPNFVVFGPPDASVTASHTYCFPSQTSSYENGFLTYQTASASVQAIVSAMQGMQMIRGPAVSVLQLEYASTTPSSQALDLSNDAFGNSEIDQGDDHVDTSTVVEGTEVAALNSQSTQAQENGQPSSGS